MCGRFVSSSTPEKIAEYFGAAFDGETLGENFNVAPTNDIYAVVAGPDGTPRLEVFHWGLIPVWAKDRKIGAKMINARAETLAEQAGVQGRVQEAPLPHPDGRLLRVEGRRARRAGDQGRQAGQAADVHPSPRR